MLVNKLSIAGTCNVKIFSVFWGSKTLGNKKGDDKIIFCSPYIISFRFLL